MAFYSGRFNTEDTSQATDLEKQIYRVRDNDRNPFNSQSKGNQCQPYFMSKDSGIHTNVIRFMSINYNDPIWQTMSEHERIENGLPTKYWISHTKPLALFASVMCGGNFEFYKL
jgi:hypothetical protein